MQSHLVKSLSKKWEKVGGVWYYFDKDGIMLSNTIFDGYIFTNSGAMAESAWVKQDGNGTMPKLLDN